MYSIRMEQSSVCFRAQGVSRFSFEQQLVRGGIWQLCSENPKPLVHLRRSFFLLISVFGWHLSMGKGSVIYFFRMNVSHSSCLPSVRQNIMMVSETLNAT